MSANLVLFPFIAVLLSVLGFLCGIPISRWHFPASLVVMGIVLWFVSPKQERKKNIVRVVVVLAASIFISMLPVMYTLTDGANCHRPACFLLAQGWNPLTQPDQSDVSGLLNSFYDTNKFRLFSTHIAYVPKASWIVGAMLYRCFGFVEIADCINIYLLITGILVAHAWLSRYTVLGKGIRIILACIIALSPHVLSSLLDGCVDSAMYLLTVIGIFQFDSYRRGRGFSDLMMGVIALSLASSVKFTGLALAVLTPTCYLIFTKARRALALALPMTMLMIFILNASPFLTGWINHGGPFYPAHSFDKTQVVKDNMTPDFDMKNKDAMSMGYVGRFSYAFLSRTLTTAYYKYKLGQESFNPQLMLFYEIDGFGGFYRMLFVLSLVVFFFVKDKGLRIMMVVLFLSIFTLPGKYMGYARYMAPLYMFPVIAAIGLLMRVENRVARICIVAVVGLSAVIQSIEPLKKIPYMWLMSVQNLQTILALEREPAPKVATGNFYSAFALRYDTHPQVDLVPLAKVQSTEFKYAYGPCNQRFSFLTNTAVPDFREFALSPVNDNSHIMNKTFFAERTKGIEKYFLTEFLPKETILLPLRFCQVMAYRGRQFSRVWATR